MPRQSTATLTVDKRTMEAGQTVLDEIGLSPRIAVELFFRQIAIRRAMPFSLEAPSTPAPGSSRIATHNRKVLGRVASLCADADGFFVLAGSRIVPRTGPFEPKSAWKNRVRHAAEVDEHGVVLRDIRFDTISGAACFVYGGSTNGKTFWKPARVRRER